MKKIYQIILICICIFTCNFELICDKKCIIQTPFLFYNLYTNNINTKKISNIINYHYIYFHLNVIKLFQLSNINIYQYYQIKNLFFNIKLNSKWKNFIKPLRIYDFFLLQNINQFINNQFQKFNIIYCKKYNFYCLKKTYINKNKLYATRFILLLLHYKNYQFFQTLMNNSVVYQRPLLFYKILYILYIKYKISKHCI